MRGHDLIILLLDSGGRGHALYRMFKKSKRVAKVYVAPGNGGIPKEDRLPLNLTDVASIIAAAKELGVDIIVPGTETPLPYGLADAGTAASIAVFGPSKAAAQLETSKRFAKEIMIEAGIRGRTGRYIVTDDYAHALASIGKVTTAWGRVPVIKADGLTGGKGVTVPKGRVDAEQAAFNALKRREFGEAGSTILIEERFIGKELSFFGMVSGLDCIMFPCAACDTKQYSRTDPRNTGGMGAFAPAQETDAAMIEMVRTDIIIPVLRELSHQGIPYIGFIYVGAMLTKNGWVVVLEFNCRLGDPEAQVILPLLDVDLVEYIVAAFTRHGLSKMPPLKLKPGLSAVCTVATAHGYPGNNVRKGDKITFTDPLDNDCTYLLHAGTELDEEGDVIVAGGRTLNSVCLSIGLATASLGSRENLERAWFPDMFFRDDIGVQT